VLGFTTLIYKMGLLTGGISIVVDRNSFLTVQPNLLNCCEVCAERRRDIGLCGTRFQRGHSLSPLIVSPRVTGKVERLEWFLRIVDEGMSWV
jgi:hypothetical protein